MTFGLQLFQFILSGLTTGSTYALIAIGFSLIHNATGIVNFAQGEFVMLGGMFMITFHSLLKLPMLPSFFLTVLSVAAIGLLLEFGPIRRAKSKEILILVMITIGASISIKGLSMILFGKNPMTLPPFSGETPLILFGAAIMPQSIWIFGITVSIVLALNYFLKKTTTGKAMRAVAASRRSAMLTGIPVDRMILLSFTFSGALGAVAGMIITPITTTSYDVGAILGLKGFSAAILGGYGSMPGAVIGGLLLGVFESLGAGLISSEYKDAVAFLILLTILFLKPSGIMGKGRLRRV
ncbi:MAG: branched-chain amino acid ABC transporter permease [Thermodesulfobacteriota bacterium]|nr:branched-chain amino acid ABC transporter permease [Thermodesulfobacteriota bacterium]